MSAALVLGMALAVGLTGCGKTEMAPVTGKISLKGAPIKGGTLVFTPILVAGSEASKGKAATAEVHADGTYSLTTERSGDGAQLGHYRVVFTPPAQELTEEQRTNPKYKAPLPLYMGMAAKPADVDVKSGANTIDLELVGSGK
jgi:hypothetical protein